MTDSKLVGLAFRKTFTPSKSAVDGTEGDRAIFNRLCQLFGKKTQDMDDMFQTENPARAAADILGYSYEDCKMKEVELHAKVEIATAVSDDTSVLKDRLMKEINEKVGERRDAIIQQRRDLFLKDNRDQDQNQVQDRLWKAIPAVVNPDSDISVEEIHSSGDRELSFATESCITMEQPIGDNQCHSAEVWNPDLAFSQVESIMDSLETQFPQSAGNYRLFNQSVNQFINQPIRFAV